MRQSVTHNGLRKKCYTNVTSFEYEDGTLMLDAFCGSAKAKEFWSARRQMEEPKERQRMIRFLEDVVAKKSGWIILRSSA